MNVRMPKEADPEFLAIQDAYLQEELKQKGITDFRELKPLQKGIYLWQGDITLLACDAIVNAANSAMCGCFVPNHTCIDNAIHTYAGVQLRCECAKMMEEQGYDEPIGRAKITSAYNLPSTHVIHTVSPVVEGKLTEHHKEQLRSCYRCCLACAEENGLSSIAFCCISTGVFRFPREEAAEIAVDEVRKWLDKTGSQISVIFNVFGNEDYEIYSRLLKA